MLVELPDPKPASESLDDPLTIMDLIAMVYRNYRILETTWDTKDKSQARTVAAVAAEQLASQIREY